MYLLADLEASYRRFLEKVVANGCVWVIVSVEGRGATLDSLHRKDDVGSPAIVELVFSEAALARDLCRNRFPGFSPKKLVLEGYMGVLGRLAGRLIIPDLNRQCAGLEVEPLALADAIREVRAGTPPTLRYLTTG